MIDNQFNNIETLSFIKNAIFTIPARSQNIPANAARIRGVATRIVASSIKIMVSNIVRLLVQ